MSSEDENSSRSSSSTSGENDSGHEEKESSGQDKDSGQEDSSEKDSSGEEENENGNNASDSEEEQKSSSGEDEAEANEKIQKRSTRITSHRTLKMDEQTLLQLENENFLRRSTRRRAETTLTESSSDEKSPPRRKRQRPSTSNESSDEESESSYSDVPRKARKTAKGKSKVETRKRNRAVNYVVPNSDSDSDLDEFMDYEEEETQQSVVVVETGNTDTIEKVLKNRNGVPGATGSQTTWYNIQNQGDPNEKFSELPSSSLERQYLIKWVGWSHLHNTWESEASLRVMGAKGLKKLENYIKKVAEFDAWRRIADKEYVEFYDCEQVMSEELLEQYKDVERVIAHQVSREKTDFGEKQTEFLVKWCGLPYSECTWEDENLIRMRFSHKIDEYFERINVETTPKKTHHYLKRRPKFQKLETIPEFLYPKDNSDLELRDYQLEGLNWLLHAWCKENSCILADEMGLGKTIQTICFLSSLFHLHELYGPFLVVVPLSTMASWLREFETWGSDMNVVTYMGDAVSRGRIREFELYGQARKIKFNVILTTYEILMKDKSLLGTFNWTALVVDEAHRLKNDDSLLYQSLYSFNSNHRLLITGTPLQNSLKELWALLHFIMPEKFDNWPEFEADHQDRDHKAIASLHKKLEPFLLRRVKKDVEKSLPAKVEQILRVDMTAHQKQYYKWILTKNYDELSKGVKGSIKGFVNLVMELKKCCNHSSLVRDYDFVPDDAQSRLHQLLKSSGKLILLDKLLCRLKETGHRVLIFSQMVMMLDILQEYMQLRRFQFQRLDGSMGSDIRKQALDHFNADGSPDFCFLLSTRAGGLGINLATADTVIIFDSDWNPQNDLQAMSRAHRIGQKRQVNIFRLVTKSSVEEDIVERAKQKLVLDHLVIQQMDTTGTTVLSKNRSNPKKLPFDKADLNAILKFGAEELFREKEGEEQEPDVDLDDILSRAEVKQCENQDGGNDLLSSFKYANVDIDEDKDLVMPEMKEENRDKDWDEIIPEDQLEKIKEEARKKEEELLNLGPRQRNKLQELPPGMEVDDDEDDGDKKRKKKKASKRRTKEVDSDADVSSDSENEGRGRKGGSKRTVLFGFTEKEVKNFIKSFRKFAHPLERLPAITQDAELEDHRTHEIEELAKEIIRLSDEAEKTHAVEKQQNDDNLNNVEEKKKVDRGPSFKIGGADFRVSLLFKQHAMLEPLHQLIIESQQNLREFEIPGNPKQIEGWDVEWSLEDDRSLLQGIHRYGMGSWEAIKMDPEFGLADKIFLKDKAKKPHPADLASRATKLLAFLSKHVKKRKIEKNDEKKSHKKERAKNDKKKPPKLKDEKSNKEKKHKRVSELQNSSNVNSPATSQRPSTSKEKKHTDKSKVLSLRINKEKYSNELADRSGATFKQCVEIFRPVIKHIKKMISEGGPITSEGLKSLRRLGDHITDYICSKTSKSSSDSSSRQEKWHSYLWIFLSKFITPEQDPVVLLEKYRQCLKNRMIEEKKNNQRHHHGHHSSHSNAAQHPQLHNSHHGSNNQHKPHNPQQQNRPSGSSFRTNEDGSTFHH